MALVHRALFTITVESGRTSTGSVQKDIPGHGGTVITHSNPPTKGGAN